MVLEIADQKEFAPEIFGVKEEDNRWTDSQSRLRLHTLLKAMLSPSVVLVP